MFNLFRSCNWKYWQRGYYRLFIICFIVFDRQIVNRYWWFFIFLCWILRFRDICCRSNLPFVSRRYDLNFFKKDFRIILIGCITKLISVYTDIILDLHSPAFWLADQDNLGSHCYRLIRHIVRFFRHGLKTWPWARKIIGLCCRFVVWPILYQIEATLHLGCLLLFKLLLFFFL